MVCLMLNRLSVISQSVLLFFVLNLSWVECNKKKEPPKTPGLQNIDELVAEGGYSVTNYEVITEDGYSLWLHRIGNTTGPPVLLQHGILAAADQWITRGPKRDLAFVLLEEGFDVWLSNLRGTFFNEYNLKYSKMDPRFWDFSFHEAGYYDIPSFIECILTTRRKEKIFYIGHSLGSTAFLVMASTRPEYNKMIQAAVFLSPIAYPPEWEELPPFWQAVIKNAEPLISFVSSTLGQQFTFRSAETVFAIRELCTRANYIRKLCLDVVAIFVGEHRSNLDEKEWDHFLPYFGAGTSLKTLRHYGQVFTSGEFKQFDYGTNSNLKKYGNPKPPTYPLDKVTARVAMYWGHNDPLMSEKSVGKLKSALPKVLYSKPVEDPLFSHIDSILGDNANLVLYPHIITFLKSFNNSLE